MYMIFLLFLKRSELRVRLRFYLDQVSPLTLILSHQGRGKKKKMGEGQDEGASPRFDTPWHVTTLIGHAKG